MTIDWSCQSCSQEEDAMYLRIARDEWKEKPPSTLELPFNESNMFCDRFLQFWNSSGMQSTRAQFGDLCQRPTDPLELIRPQILGICQCACT